MPSAAEIAERLTRASPAPPPADTRLAAVAIVLRLGPEPDVLLMRRAEREGDRWSGQIGLPGGHAEQQDRNLLATATRETREELGLELATVARPLGRLDPIQARARGEKLAMHVVPFAFEQIEAAELQLGPEASAAFRLPLRSVQAGELDAPYPYQHEGLSYQLPSWRFGEHVVWGMTHRILSAFLAAALPESS